MGAGVLIRDGSSTHRALRALIEVDGWATEEDVWVKANKLGGKEHVKYYEGLNSLVQHEYAERSGERGGYLWRVTDKGRARIEETA